MATKKRRTKKQIELSQRAKRGWATRRKNQISRKKKQLENVRKGLPEKELAKLDKKKKKEPTKRKPKQNINKINEDLKRENERIKAELEEAQEILRIWKGTDNWVDAMDPEMLREDNSIALEPSRARYQFIGEIAHGMREYMLEMDSLGRLDEAASLVADQLELPIREIYTLFFSP